MPSKVRNEYAPREVSPPGATLAEILDERGMTQAELATRLDRPTKTINEIVKGKAAITAETALQLERALGTPAAFWTAREANYREWLARKNLAAEVAGETDWLRELPIADMVRSGWIRKAASKAEQVLECLGFFGVASVAAWRAQYERPLAAYRASPCFEKRLGPTAAWLREGERQAAQVECEPFDSSRFRSTLGDARALTRESDPSVFVPKLVALCARCGVAVVFVPAPKGCPVTGATRWLTPSKAVLQLSLRHKKNDVLWFTFFHEAGHLLLHGKKMLFVDIDHRTDEEAEREADRFAADLLIPRPQAERLARLGVSAAEVTAFADQLGIAAGIVVGRMNKEGLLPWTHLQHLKVSYDWRRTGTEGE